MAFIEVIEYEKATGELKTIYDDLIASRGKLADVHTLQSLNPATIVSHMALYKDIMFGKSPLKRYQREMMAVVVSAANQCEYCMKHHREALLHYWKDEKRADALLHEPKDARLSDEDLALCAFAKSLTLQPGASSEEGIALLKKTGLDDRAVLDAALVVAYFNFVNRMVLGLGLAVNEAEIKGYQYE